MKDTANDIVVTISLYSKLQLTQPSLENAFVLSTDVASRNKGCYTSGLTQTFLATVFIPVD